MLRTKIRKAKAFTLSEMMVVLVITVIVVGLAFSVLNLVQKQMAGIDQNYEYKTKTNLLRQALWIDFNTYHQIFYNDQTNSLHGENELGSVVYVFREEWIIRNRDTLKIKLQGKKLYFDGMEITSGQIDGIELVIDEKTKPKSLFVYKDNGANVYLK